MRIRQIAVAVAAALAAYPPAAAAAHDGIGAAAAHRAQDSVIHDASRERRLTAETAARTAADAAMAAESTAGAPEDVGAWGPLEDWPVVAVHAALLPDGRVLAYDSVGDRDGATYEDHTFTRATVWDPATGDHDDVRVQTGYNIFCSGLAHLPDGTVFIAGGNKNAQFDGIAETHVFTPATNSWALGPTMSVERWYPSVTPLATGEMLITDGGPDLPEVRTGAGTLRPLSTAELDLPLYPWLDVAPDGRVLYSGPDETLRMLDASGTGAWETFGQRDSIDRDFGSRAFYAPGKLLIAGGGPSTHDARVIDFADGTPAVSATAQMANGRRQHNLTVLADGSVLATGGNSSGVKHVDLDHGVYAAERWDPATGEWTTLASEQVTRQYHSTALLLPDGRVLSAGGGVCDVCDDVGYLAKNGQLFTPPYLFRRDGSGQLATRPVVTAVSSTLGYGWNFTIGTPDAARIAKVALVRLGAVTHSVNMEQRYVPLTFSATSGALAADAPAQAAIAPPGVYMLFVIDSSGVPSVARMVMLGDFPAPPVPPPPPEPSPTPTAGSGESSGDAPGSVPGDQPAGGAAGPVGLPTISIKRPRVLKPGAKLRVPRAVAGFETPRYRWLRQGRRIHGADERVYKIRRQDRGKRIRCRIRLTPADGGDPVVITTAAVKIPRRVR
jgi:hypothetical protein